MDQHCLPTVTRSLTSVPSRRDVLRGLVGAGLGLGVTRLPDVAEAKKKRKKKPKPKPPKPNAFGCLDVGAACKNAVQCCSGICEGQKGKRTCRGHNAGLCRPASNYCTTGVQAICHATTEPLSVSNCWLTTGKAAFCARIKVDDCRECAKDADCEAEFGPGAACIDLSGGICGDQNTCADTGRTACAAAVV